MTIVKIEQALCHKDELCIKECPALLLIKDDDGYPKAIKNAEDQCIDCGHCVAVCPHGALSHKFLTAEDCLKMDRDKILSKEGVEYFLRRRRSIRQYKDINVDKKIIKQLLYIGKYAPTARNLQPINWTVVGDKSKVNHVAKLVLEWIKTKRKSDEFLHLGRIIDAWERGRDRILRNAPTLLVGHAHKNFVYAKADVATSISYMELAAPSYGLGTCWAGYLTSAAQDSYELKEYIKVPKDHLVHGSMMVGFPNVRYYRLPERKKPKVVWI